MSSAAIVIVVYVVGWILGFLLGALWCSLAEHRGHRAALKERQRKGEGND